ncbi:MAG: aminotransferase class I/II-fold pyridoxal phosphate-dependent enzyme [Candidatus Aminicenantes bacterium]|nr:aminotransferase class I/II-fold pyridoxal phosphate-dependent enzyme [Candidatus Aminicenantes bacterium]
MALKKDDLGGKGINCDDYSLVDFQRFESDDLFEVADYFWEYMSDAVRKKYMVYGQPIMSRPGSEFKVFDRNANAVRRFLNFCSYNYLGYSLHPEVSKAVQSTIGEFGTGAVSAPLLSGYYDQIRMLEEEIAKLKGKESAIVFSTGYATNVGVLSGLLRPGDVAVLDILSHASIYDGVRLSGADIKVFAHNNPRQLEKVLKGLNTKRVIVCVEGVYSMDGDLANLPEIIPVCKKYGAKILVDEAHASLIFGEKGGGVAEHFGLEEEVDISIGTFSKSFGAIGGYAAGKEKLMAYLRMVARSYVFSCAMAPHTAAGILKVLELFGRDKSEHDKLWYNTRYMHTKLKEVGLDIANTKSQVVPVMAGADLRLREISKRIQQKGLYTGVVTYPAVSKNKTRLRLSVSSMHTKAQIDDCVRILKEVFDSMADWKPGQSTAVP